MVTVGSKTPVSIVQEYGVSINQIPSYELISGEQGTHNPHFIYRVRLGDLFADGTGSSKQRAKHNAAQFLIDIIKHSKEADSGELESCSKILSDPQDNLINFNAVGILNEYCEEKQCPPAIYTLVQDEGPPHAKIFTMKCAVSHLVAHGTSRTKKQAKHCAAHEMVNKLKALSGEECTAIMKHSPDVVPNSPIKVSRQKNDAEVEENFLALSKLKRRPNNSAYIGDQHKAILNLIGKSATLSNLVSSSKKFEDIDDKVETLQKIANELGVTIASEQNIPGYCLYFVKLPVKPAIVVSGLNYKDAAEKVLKLFLSYFV